MKERYSCELLSPAGNLDIFYGVINAGADAVYVGGEKFGARAYANNFNQEELLTAIDYAHINGRKLYLTVNTLLKEREMEQELYEYLYPFYREGLDAVIIQDLGLIPFLKEHFPNLDLHASTQMSLGNDYGASLLKENGVQRVVLARELSLQEINNIYNKTHMEIECFVHGALCYCYSGQCLMSSMIGGRSGNRGRCAQPCRLPYQVLDKEGELIKQQSNILSLKDLSTLFFLPELLENGIFSLKIEGRMKQAAYATGVTAMYRKKIDLLQEKGKEGYTVTKADEQFLLDTGNRSGFTDGYYYHHNSADMITYENASHISTEQENDLEKEHGKVKLPIDGTLQICYGEKATLRVQYHDTFGEAMSNETVEKAKKQPLTIEDVTERMKKTGATNYVFQNLKVSLDSHVFLTNGELNELRRKAIQNLEENLLSGYFRRDDMSFSSSTVTNQNKENQRVSPSISASVLNLKTVDLLALDDSINRIYIPLYEASSEDEIDVYKSKCEMIHESGKECYGILPSVFRLDSSKTWEKNWNQISQIPWDGFLTDSLDGLSFLNLKKNQGAKSFSIISDLHLYAFNRKSVQFLMENGASYYTIPVELNYHELKELPVNKGELLIYGRTPLMVSANCVLKNTTGCKHTEQISYLKDRKSMVFPVQNICSCCYNIIYNSKPLSLLHLRKQIAEIPAGSYRLSFTTETDEEIKDVLTSLKDGQSRILDYTKGHFNRGVE